MDNSIFSLRNCVCGGVLLVVALLLVAVWLSSRLGRGERLGQVDARSQVQEPYYSTVADEPRIVTHERDRLREPRGEVLTRICRRARAEAFMNDLEKP